MGIVVQTNVTSLIAQNNLTTATKRMDQAMERMTTGYKINSAKDDAAGLYVATSLDKNIRGSEVAQKNVQMGNDMISVAEGDLSGIQDNLLRIRDLALTAANGIYDQASLDAIKAEVVARLDEIDRISQVSEYNGKKLLNGDLEAGVTLQVGANTTDNDIIDIQGVFNDAMTSALGIQARGANVGQTYTEGNTTNVDKDQMIYSVDDIFKIPEDGDMQGDGTTPETLVNKIHTFVNDVDYALEDVQTRRTNIGAIQNRLDSAAQSLTTTIENLTSSKSTIMDADIAKESTNYINAQILQQAAGALLVQANQTPQIALSLI